MSHYAWHQDTLILSCVIQPKAKSDEVVGPHNNALKIRINAPPIDGKANRHLIDYLSKQFGVPKSSVKIMKGAGSREKSVAIKRPRKLPENAFISR